MGATAVLWDWPGRFLAALSAERSRWVLWFPVLVGIGIAAYFALAWEPAAGAGPVALILALLLSTLVQWRRPEWAVLAWICLAGPALGFTAAQIRTALVDAPQMQAEVGPTAVTGRVTGIERLAAGLRLVLDQVTIQGVPPAETPAALRISIRKPGVVPEAGDRVRLFAAIGPPGDPVEPGAFDFRRHLYYQGIGGSGFALGALRIQERGADDAFLLERWRQIIADRVSQRLPGAVGGMTAALLNGEVAGIPEEDMLAMRQSGLQHLLSISGLHVGLVAGLVFLILRGGMALIPAFALRHPIKKYAAVAALAAAFFYMLLVGSPVPTQRSVLMTAVMLLAVLVDRNPFSLRVVGVAALAVILVQPEALVGPSFQMSFAAVIALIAAFEAITPWMAARRRDGDGGRLGRIATYVGGLALTSLVAGSVTIPFGLHHFQQMQNYGLLANMVAVPITSFWVMPWGLIVCLLMPFGLEGWAVTAMGWGVELILETAHRVADLPGAAVQLPLLPGWGLALFTLSGLWLCLWQGRVRRLGLIGMALGLLALPLADLPDLRVSGDGKVVGVRLADGGMAVSTRRAGRFDSDEWAQRDGLTDNVRTWPKQGTKDGRLRCEAGACVYAAEGRRVGIALTPDAVAVLCGQQIEAIIARWNVRDCAVPLIIDGSALAARGAHALYFQPTGIKVETTRPAPGARPWN